MAGSPTGLDPLIGMNDADKPLRSKVLAVPEYRERYLRNLRELAEQSLNWEALGPFIASQTKLIGDSVNEETRGLVSYGEFVAATCEETERVTDTQRPGPPGLPLKSFVDGRHQFLIDYKPNVEEK